MSIIPQLDPIESRFEWEKAHEWLRGHWHLSVYCSAVYVALVFLGKRWMRDKPAYSLRRPLAMWNAGLALFSLLGFLTIGPPLLRSWKKNGFAFTTCNDIMYVDTSRALWGFLFVLSKLVEFGDTLFIVLRRTPLSFLHWYHHITVFTYCAYNVAQKDPTGDWFGAVNYFVHTVMYSYYLLKASAFKVPAMVAQSITVLQLAQFGLGLVVLAISYREKASGVACDVHYDVLYAGLAMYSSYLVLFANFFYRKYIMPKPKRT